MLNILNIFYISAFKGIMGTIIIILVSVIGFGALTYAQGKHEGYIQGRIDGYEECKKNFNRIQEFKQKILNKKLDIWKDTK